MNRVYVLDTRSCFTHGVNELVLAEQPYGRLAWGALGPLFRDDTLVDELRAQLEEA